MSCSTTRNLRITEVGANRLELFLDEPFGRNLNLTGLNFEWVSQNPNAQPTRGALRLDAAGSMTGGQFLVIYEDARHAGAPVLENFRPNTPGIKVRDDFFPGYGSNPGVSMRVSGEHVGTSVLFIPTQERVNDVVRFGPTPRPSLSGAFVEDNSLSGVKPQGSDSISRRFAAGRPVDTDREAEWSLTNQTIGLPNP